MILPTLTCLDELTAHSALAIRVNHPMDLVAWLMKDNPDWTPAQIKNFIDQGKEQIVNLDTPVQVHIVYLTAWAWDDGLVISGY